MVICQSLDEAGSGLDGYLCIAAWAYNSRLGHPLGGGSLIWNITVRENRWSRMSSAEYYLCARVKANGRSVKRPARSMGPGAALAGGRRGIGSGWLVPRAAALSYTGTALVVSRR